MNKFFKTVLLTGLFVGTTDILSAFLTVYIKSGKFPEKMFHYLAGGALGLDVSMKGGVAVAFLGLFFHYFIALAFTLFFFMLFPHIKFLSFNKYLIGTLYAIFVNQMMDQVILRLTPLPSGKFDLASAYIGWISFAIVFGIPIAWSAYKLFGVKEEA